MPDFEGFEELVPYFQSIREVTTWSRFAPFGAFSLSNQGIADVGFAGDQVMHPAKCRKGPILSLPRRYNVTLC